MGDIWSKVVNRLSLIYRVVAVVAVAALIVLLFPHTHQGEHYDYKTGAVWRNADLVAPYDFAVLKSSDELGREQSEERQKALLYYREDSTAYGQALERLA